MYQADQIQSMINELDRVLCRTGRWRLWTLFTQLHDQRQMLERVRNFLLMQQRSDRTATPELAPIAPQALMRPLPPPHLHPDSVKLEVAALMAQRDALREEVKFLSALAQTPDPKTPASSSALVPTLAPDTRQIEQLSALHDRTDFLLSSMDSSLQMAFTSMQKNVEVYQTTLHQGLDRMHNLGYQGEVLFSALINHLAQQMGRELAANPVNSATNPVTNSAINLTTAFPNYSTAQDVPPIHSPLDSSTPKPTRSTPETEPSPLPQPETAVRFSPETALGDREMTLDTLFGNPFDEIPNEISNKTADEAPSDIFGDIFGETFANTFGDSFGETLSNTLGDFGGSSSDSGLDFARTNSPLGSEVNNDITLEEMNALFADIPSLKS